MPYFNKALNIVYNAPEGSGISGWKSYDGQRNRFILIDNLTKSGNDKVHDIIYSYYREGLDQLTEKPELAKSKILNALINTAGGASWVSLHHGGGVGIGYSIHAGMVIVADGTDEAAARIKRVLHNDPAMGVIRHADAGYDIATDTARKHRLDIRERLK